MKDEDRLAYYLAEMSCWQRHMYDNLFVIMQPQSIKEQCALAWLSMTEIETAKNILVMAARLRAMQ
ncbi:MAG: hypothetical protein H6Q65_1461 [Firmicutes bacterium]|nr:hypothetical protein [Bacillota bacterium]